MGDESEATVFVTRQMSVLRGVGEHAEWCVDSGREFTSIYTALMRGLKPLINCDDVALCRFEDYRVQIISGNKTMTTARPAGLWFPLAGSLAAECADRMKLLYIPDLTDRPNSPEIAWLLAEGFRSTITCPLIVDGSAIGAIYCLSKLPEDFKPEHLQAIATLAEPFARVVEKWTGSRRCQAAC